LESHLGSATIELDEHAKVLSYEEYSPYGSTTYQGNDSTLETPKRYRFTGKERDEESGLNYNGARYYAPWLARWCSPDPSGTNDGVNTFVYCHCNPVVGVDTTGKDDSHFESLRSLFNEVGEIFAGKPGPTPLTPNATKVPQEQYRQWANTENKRFKANPPPETPITFVDKPSPTFHPEPWTGSDVQVSHLAGAKEAYESQIQRADWEKLPKERMRTVTGEAAVMDPKTGKVQLLSHHRGVQEGAIIEPALERARAANGGKLTPEALKETAEYAQWKGSNIPLSEGNRELIHEAEKKGLKLMPDKTLTKDMIHEAEHAGTDLFKKAAKKSGKGAKVLKALGKAGGHLAAAVPILGIAATQISAGYSRIVSGYTIGRLIGRVHNSGKRLCSLLDRVH
jgi:RHS repeat-associated protein